MAYRLQEVERAIPFDEVVDSWSKRRNQWLKDLVAKRADQRRLGGLVAVLLDALKPKAIAMLWQSDKVRFTKLRDASRRVAQGYESAKSDISELMRIVHELEEVAIPPPPSVEVKLLGRGKPALLDLGDDGPSLEVGASCYVLDIRMVWCRATVENSRCRCVLLTRPHIFPCLRCDPCAAASSGPPSLLRQAALLVAVVPSVALALPRACLCWGTPVRLLSRLPPRPYLPVIPCAPPELPPSLPPLPPRSSGQPMASTNTACIVRSRRP